MDTVEEAIAVIKDPTPRNEPAGKPVGRLNTATHGARQALARANGLAMRVPGRVWIIGTALVVLAYPWILDNNYWIRVGSMVALYAILGLGLNTSVGFAGLFDMGFVAFYAVGGYTYALLCSPQFGLHLPFWAALLASMTLATVTGAIIGSPSLRVRGDYLGIITFGFFQIILLLIINLDKPVNITNGPNGVVAVDPPGFLGWEMGESWQFFYLIAASSALAVFTAMRLLRSRVGRAWAAIRDDEITASSMGVNLGRYKILAFAAAACFAGLAGALLASWQSGVFPDNFSLSELVTIYLIVVLGGAGNPIGTVFGAVALIVLGEVLRPYGEYRMIIYAIVLLLVMRFLPNGIVKARARRSRTTLQAAVAGEAGIASATAVPETAAAEPSNAPAARGTTIRTRRPAFAVEDEPPKGVSAPSTGPVSAARGDVLLAVNDLGKSFSGIVAVDGVSFEVRRGEILGVIGPNGAGKTTLFNLITGIYKPDRGSVWFAGRDITGLPSHKVAARGLARTFQNIRVLPQLSVLDNVLTGAHHRLKAGVATSILRTPRVRRAEQEAEADSIRHLAFFSERLAQRKDDYVTALNYADRRRVEIARAMTLGPELILLDEPAAGMNPAEVEEITKQILELRERGYTIVLVEHQMPVVMGVSDRILVVNKGQVLAEGTPEYVQRHEEVVKAYLGAGDEAKPARAPRTTTAAEARPLLQMQGLDAGYGAIEVLKGLSMEVRQGEIICLLGANAAGKSTTIKTILGNVRPTAGMITFDGRRIERWSTERIIKSGIGVVPEGRRIFADLTVLENMEMGAYTVRSAATIKQGLEVGYTQFPILHERRHQKAGTLSGGEQQMLAMARALMTEPRLLLLDEPSMGLSPILVQSIMEIVQGINRNLGTTVLMVEQNANMALQIADRGYVLQTGRIVAADTAANLLQADAVKEAYLGG